MHLFPRGDFHFYSLGKISLTLSEILSLSIRQMRCKDL